MWVAAQQHMRLDIIALWDGYSIVGMSGKGIASEIHLTETAQQTGEMKGSRKDLNTREM